MKEVRRVSTGGAESGETPAAGYLLRWVHTGASSFLSVQASSLMPGRTSRAPPSPAVRHGSRASLGAEAPSGEKFSGEKIGIPAAALGGGTPTSRRVGRKGGEK